MSKQKPRIRQHVKTIASVDNGVKKAVGRGSVLYQGRFVVRSNHMKVGVQHFSV